MLPNNLVASTSESGTRPPLTRAAGWIVIAAALLAVVAKLYCAWTTLGSNDVTTFQYFAQVIDAGGLKAAYQLGPIFNHPPLVGGFLLTINWIAKNWHIPFPFLLRLPAIVADLLVVLALLWCSARRAALRLPLGLWLVFALSPVSFMISGFHGNTDPVMVLWLVLAAIMCCEDRPAAGGLFLALALHTKVAGLIVAPVFFFFWLGRGKAWRFSLVCALVLLVGWIEPLLLCPKQFLENVFGYSSYWGIWGLTYWLLMTHFTPFYGHLSTALSPEQRAVVALLKIIIVSSILVLAWRRRKLAGEQIFSSLALAWGLFFVFSPGVATQYLVWPACFLLFYSGSWYLAVTATCALFQFFFYNAISHGMPWNYGVSDGPAAPFWRPWAMWPWMAFSIGLFWIWKTTGSPRLFSLETIQDENSPANAAVEAVQGATLDDVDHVVGRAKA